uniref:hypothetical protein n=1 Tax=uncultured Sphingomonas sp. TaxID=158754 RepID=UPI0035CC06FA
MTARRQRLLDALLCAAFGAIAGFGVAVGLYAPSGPSPVDSGRVCTSTMVKC